MQTQYQVIGTDSIARTGEVDWPKEPGYTVIRDLVEPLIQTPGTPEAYFEHVRVWYEGQYASMFVDDMGALKGLPINPAATKIYHANMFEHDPDFNPEDAPSIFGPAVLFSRNVWY